MLYPSARSTGFQVSVTCQAPGTAVRPVGASSGTTGVATTGNRIAPCRSVMMQAPRKYPLGPPGMGRVSGPANEIALAVNVRGSALRGTVSVTSSPVAAGPRLGDTGGGAARHLRPPTFP